MVSAYVGSAFDSVFLAYLPFSVASLYFLYVSNTKVVLKTLNSQRADRVLFDYVLKLRSQKDAKEHPNVLHPSEIGRLETFIYPYRSQFSVPLYTDPPFHSISLNLSHENLTRLLSLTENAKHRYIIFCSGVQIRRSGKVFSKGIPSVSLWFHHDSDRHDLLRGTYHSAILRKVVQESSDRGFQDFEDKNFREWEEVAESLTQESFSGFQRELRLAGWQLDHLFVDEDLSRISVERKLKGEEEKANPN